MEAKIAWKSENMRKKAWWKSMLKFDAEKKANADFEIDFWVNFGAVRGERGVAEFKLRLQADFNSRFTRPAPQAGVRRMNKWCQKGPKIDAKINI